MGGRFINGERGQEVASYQVLKQKIESTLRVRWNETNPVEAGFVFFRAGGI